LCVIVCPISHDDKTMLVWLITSCKYSILQQQLSDIVHVHSYHTQAVTINCNIYIIITTVKNKHASECQPTQHYIADRLLDTHITPDMLCAGTVHLYLRLLMSMISVQWLLCHHQSVMSSQWVKYALCKCTKSTSD